MRNKKRHKHGPIATPISKRFWKYVLKTNSCWLWIGAKANNGYGVINNKKRKQIRAHRFSWEFHRGKIPKGIWVLHKCDNPPCINPSHLFLGEHQDNVNDQVQKGRHVFGERHGRSKLKEKDIINIRKEWDFFKKSHTELSKKYGVGIGQIGNIIRKESWSHI